MNKIWALLLAVTLSPTVSFDLAAQSKPANFVGTWRLAESTGPADRGRGANSLGLMFFDQGGRMAVQVMPDRPRPKFAAAEPTPEEAKAALNGYSAYFGTYQIDERAGTLAQRRLGSLNPGEVGGDFVRRYQFIGEDRLVLTPLEGPGRSLTWERVK